MTTIPNAGPRAALVITALLASSACKGALSSEGQALFEANCAECHGERALGDGPLAGILPVAPPSLLDHLGHHPMDQLVSIIRTGVPPAMPPAPLTEAEVRQVIDYAWTLVPDSLVNELREMQRMTESGMEMGGEMQRDDDPEMEGGMEMGGSMEMRPDSAGR